MYETLKFTEMTTRRVIDAKDKDGEKVYVKGHAKATYMSDGRTVDEAVNNKVDKVDGKQLSTEDFTTLFKQKLEGLNNYNDAELTQALSSLQSQLNTLVSGNASAAINNFNEIISFLEGVSDSENLDNIIAAINQNIAAKQNEITDLAAIRSGASKGATALQPQTGGSGTKFLADDNTYKEIDIPEGDFATKEELEEKQDKVDIVDHGTGDTTIVLTPNILHKWGTVESLTLTLAVPTDTTIANYYMAQFTCGSTATSINLPDTIKWITEPSIEANKTYQISILDNLGVIGGA